MSKGADRNNRPWGFFRARKGLSRLRLVLAKLPSLLSKDLGRNLVNLAALTGLDQTRFVKRLSERRSQVNVSASLPAVGQGGSGGSESVRPVIFASACAGKESPGGWKYNGGIKLLNNLVKLLRRHGYEAYMVTYDGDYEPWLIDHQPHLSLEEFRIKAKAAPAVRCVTSWAQADAFLTECAEVYFWDMELAWTEHSHFPALARLYREKIRKAAAISRTVQAWHMAHFDRPCVTLPLLIDEGVWRSSQSVRSHLRIGYMEEGQLTTGYIEHIRQKTRSAGLDLEFHLLHGAEVQILSGMQSCEVFLGMNAGKDPLWGEGCPLATLESLSAGCAFVAFDILGNREIIEPGFNGLLVPTRRPDLMATALIELYQKAGEIARLRNNADLLRVTCQTMEARWPIVREFLELDERHF